MLAPITVYIAFIAHRIEQNNERNSDSQNHPGKEALAPVLVRRTFATIQEQDYNNLAASKPHEQKVPLPSPRTRPPQPRKPTSSPNSSPSSSTPPTTVLPSLFRVPRTHRQPAPRSQLQWPGTRQGQGNAGSSCLREAGGPRTEGSGQRSEGHPTLPTRRLSF